MSYRREHLAELDLTLWRLREEGEAESAGGEAPPVQVPSRREAVRVSQIVEEAPPAESDDARARRIARMGWEDLEAFVRGQSRSGATQAVFGVGARQADLMVIGEAPGADEDRQGEPFVGRAGQLLDQMLRAIDHSRSRNTYIANICKFRPPNNRDPRPEEVAEDLPYLKRQIELVAPRVLLAVGRVAAQNLLGTEDAIGRMRGKPWHYQGCPVVVSYHPAYLLRSPREKAKAWQDLKRVRSLLLAA